MLKIELLLQYIHDETELQPSRNKHLLHALAGIIYAHYFKDVFIVRMNYTCSILDQGTLVLSIYNLMKKSLNNIFKVNQDLIDCLHSYITIKTDGFIGYNMLPVFHPGKCPNCWQLQERQNSRHNFEPNVNI